MVMFMHVEMVPMFMDMHLRMVSSVVMMMVVVVALVMVVPLTIIVMFVFCTFNLMVLSLIFGGASACNLWNFYRLIGILR